MELLMRLKYSFNRSYYLALLLIHVQQASLLGVLLVAATFTDTLGARPYVAPASSHPQAPTPPPPVLAPETWVPTLPYSLRPGLPLGPRPVGGPAALAVARAASPVVAALLSHALRALACGACAAQRARHLHADAPPVAPARVPAASAPHSDETTTVRGRDE